MSRITAINSTQTPFSEASSHSRSCILLVVILCFLLHKEQYIKLLMEGEGQVSGHMRMPLTSRKGPDHEKRKPNRQIANRREACMLESSAG